MHQRQGNSPTFTGFPTLSTLALSKRLPGVVRYLPAHWEQGEAWGMLSYAASAFCSAMMIVTVKLALQEGLSTWELLMARSLFLAAVCVIELRRSNDNMLGQRRGLLSLRGALGCCSVTALFFATQQLPVADATVFSFLAPAIVAVLSPAFLQESSKGAWVAISGCTIGVLLVAQPGMLFGETRLTLFGVCLGILHSTASGTAKMCVRALKEEVTHVKMLYLAMFSILLSGAVMLFLPWTHRMPSWYSSMMLLACGVWGYGVQIFMTMGLERARAAKAMTMAYTSIVWSELAGIFLFQEVPNTWAVLGVVVIVGSTFYNSQASIKKPETSTFFPETAGAGMSGAEQEAILYLARGPSSTTRSPEQVTTG